MSTQSSDSDPSMGEAAAYFGTGAFAGLVLVVAVGLSIIGFRSSSDSRDERLDAAGEEFVEDQLDDGGRIYAQRCASCHGSEGEGGVGPAFVGVAERLADPSEHEAIVRDGRNAMPPFGGSLSDEQIAIVVRYEREVLDAG